MRLHPRDRGAALALLALLALARGAVARSPPLPEDAPSTSTCAWLDAAAASSQRGVVSDGSGERGTYLPNSNCTWIIRPEVSGASASANATEGTTTAAAGITLVFPSFKTVFDDDFLYVTDVSDASSPNPLAAYTGILPPLTAARFENVTALKLEFVTAEENRDAGFEAVWLADGSCYNDCRGGGGGGGDSGRCVDGLCVCDDDHVGADCSIPVPRIPGDGVGVNGSVGVGEYRYFRVDVPSDPPGLMLKLELTFPNGDSDGARPMLMLANASAAMSGDPKAAGKRGNPGAAADDAADDAVTYFDDFATKDGGDCGPYPGCRWANTDARGPADIPPNVCVAGDANAFRLGGQPLVRSLRGRDAFPRRDVLLPAHPTPHYNALVDARDWDTHADHHHLYVTNEAYSPKYADGRAKVVLTPGTWIVGVTNTETTPLPRFLAGTVHDDIQWWGPCPGFEGAVNGVNFTLSATLSDDVDEMCLKRCGDGGGVCDAGTCRCGGGGDGADVDGVDAAGDALVVGEHCEHVAATLEPGGETVKMPTLHIGQWAYAFVPSPKNVDEHKNHPLLVELSHGGTPAASPMLFATASNDAIDADGGIEVPSPDITCAAFWGSGPYGDVHCHVTGYGNADFQFPPPEAFASGYEKTVTAAEIGMDYASIVIPPEARLDVGDGFYVGVWNHPSYSGDALEYELRATYVTPGEPSCPFACGGNGKCGGGGSGGGGGGGDIEPSDAAVFVDATARDWTCSCAPNATGAYCQDELTTLALDADVTRTLENGAWDYFVLDLPAFAGSGADDDDDDERLHSVLIEIDKIQRDAFPLVYVKRGGPPAAFAAVYSSTVREAVIALDPDANGVGVAALADAGNSRINLTGAVPANARVIGLRYDLSVEATFPSYVSEACLAFESGSRGYEAIACPSDLAASGTKVVVGGTSDAGGRSVDVDGGGGGGGSDFAISNLNVVAFDVPEDGVLFMELFESYDDFKPDDAATGGENLASEPPDSRWNGTVAVLFRERVAIGHDYQDVESAYCTGIDCAVGDEHGLVFPLAVDDADADAVAPAPPGDGRYYVGVYNSRIGSPSGTLSQHESARFAADMTYTIRASASSNAAPACVNDCNGVGECLPTTTPACRCDPGFFGPGCSVSPVEIPLVDDVGTAAGFVPEGHFEYRFVDVPADAKFLVVNLTFPLHQASAPRVFARRGAIPAHCDSILGAASGCVDAYDASDENAGDGDVVWTESGAMLVRTLKIDPRDPRGEGGGAGGVGGGLGGDVTSVAAELNKREAEAALALVAGRDADASDPEKTVTTVNATLDFDFDFDYDIDGGVLDGLVDRWRLPAALRRRWYVAVYNDIHGGESLTFSLGVRVSSVASCVVPDCSGHGTCDLKAGVCACEEGYFGASCFARMMPVDADAAAPTRHDEALSLGEFTFFTFRVNCTGQDASIVFTKRQPGDENATSSGGTGTEVELAVRHGSIPTLDDGGFLDGVVSATDEPDAWIKLHNARPGTYYGVVHVSAGEALRAFALDVALEGSRVPNAHNQCEYADDQLVMEIYAPSGTYARLGPTSGSTGSSVVLPVDHSLMPADIYEPAYGACGDVNETTTTATAAAAKHCYLGDGHSSGRVRDLPRDAGHGPVEGRVVLGLATPADVDDRAYFYVYGDVRKYYGRFPGDLLAVGSVAERPTLAFQGEPNDSNNVDLEACGPLKNAEDVRGNVCLVVRGTCPFSAKTLACQAAGAVAVILVNDDFDEGAADNWIGSHDPAEIKIPTISYGGRDGNMMLNEMFDASIISNASSASTNVTLNATPWEAYARDVTVKAYAYRCEAPSKCPACAPGLATPADGCSSAACPGMDPALSHNCSERGVGPHGGCSLAPRERWVDLTPRFACECARGYAGAACEISHDPPAFTTTPEIVFGAAATTIEDGDVFTFTVHADASVDDVDVVYVLEGAGAPGAAVDPKTGEFTFNASGVRAAAASATTGDGDGGGGPTAYAFRIAAVDELGGKSTTDFLVAVGAAAGGSAPVVETRTRMRTRENPGRTVGIALGCLFVATGLVTVLAIVITRRIKRQKHREEVKKQVAMVEL